MTQQDQSPTVTTHKTCHGVKLPASSFAANKTNSDGLQDYCRDCMKVKKAAYHAKRRAKPDEVAPLAAAAKPGTERLREVDEDAFDDTPAIVMGELGRDLIVPSRTNPRTHFDATFLKELASSIRAHGIAQPILVRPLPGARLEETYTDRRADAPRPTHEIVAGEQRWRAAGAAGLRKVPVLVRMLTDSQVLELQLVENLKRRDLHPMEEAEGYERLRAETGMTADEVAEKIGKGRAYVYKTLKLLDLEPEAREAFYAGQLTRSTAELVAMRAPNLQLQLLKEITSTDFHGEPMSFRKAKAHVEDHYMLRLGSAPFKPADETLVPAVGSCTACPKRSGANPELFGDVAHADTCTDTACFGTKKEAHYLRIQAAAEAKGQEVIVGRQAKEVMPDGDTLRGFMRVDAAQDMGGEMKSLRDVLGDDMPTPTLLENPTTHEMIEVLPTAVAGQALKNKGVGKPTAAPAAPSEAVVQKQGVEQFERAWRRAAIEKIDDALIADMAGGFNAPVLRLLAAMLLPGLGAEQRQLICERLELGKIAQREAIESHIRDCSEDEIDRVLMLLLVNHDLCTLVDGATNKAAPAARLETIATEYGVDLAKVKSGVKAQIKRAASDSKVDAAVSAVQADRAKPTRKPKPTQAEVATAIASQLQAADNPNAFSAGQRVRIKSDIRRGVDVFQTLDTYAEVIEPDGDRAWVIRPDHLSFTLVADYTELELAES